MKSGLSFLSWVFLAMTTVAGDLPSGLPLAPPLGPKVGPPVVKSHIVVKEILTIGRDKSWQEADTLSLFYPGSWNVQISTGQGLMAVALVIFARWDPVRCLGASLLFGGVGSLGLALQGLKLTSAASAYLWNAAPYVLTLGIMILTSSRARAMIGAPAELSLAR